MSLFGTDGIRGTANRELTPELAMKTGQAAAYILKKEKAGRPVILLGRDTRLSGDMIESALIAGITSMGCDVVNAGVIPTPAAPFLARSLQLDFSIVITASHNPMADNGIKCFSSHGYKLLEPQEKEIELIVMKGIPVDFPRPVGADVGKIMPLKDGADIYGKFVMSRTQDRFEDFRIALDCANGSTHKTAPEIFSALGARTISINVHPDGHNINDQCGATHPELLSAIVKHGGFNAGFAFDGDGDRLVAVDEEGSILDGDQLLAVFALHSKDKAILNAKTLVATVMSNMGLDKTLARAGIRLLRSDVGDRNVVKLMLSEDAVLGGEQSGHVVFLKDNTTGDGIITALHLMEIMKETGRSLSSLKKEMTVFPQVTKNVPVEDKKYILIRTDFADFYENLIKSNQDKFRILVRPSGTEPLIRVMAEGPDLESAESIVDTICEKIKQLDQQKYRADC